MSQIIGMGPKGPITVIRDENNHRTNGQNNTQNKPTTVTTIFDVMPPKTLAEILKIAKEQKKILGSDSPVTMEDMLKAYSTYQAQHAKENGKTVCYSA